MKKLLVLPGNSPRNKAWGEACATFFQDYFDVVYLSNYNHWETGAQVINFTSELEKIDITVAAGEEDDEWYICAKSVGSLLALLAMHDELIVPNRCVFFGMPLDMALQDLFKDSLLPLQALTAPTLVFHNVADPVAAHDVTKNLLAEHVKVTTFVSLEGDTHDYLDFTAYAPQVRAFLSL